VTTLRERLEFRAARASALLPPRALVRLSGRPAVSVDGNVLDPGLQFALAALERRNDPPTETLTPDEARALRRRQALSIQGVPVEVGAVRDLQVDGAEGPLRARHYLPPEGGGPHPLLVYFHGGGFVIGDLDTHDGVCRNICRHAGVQVLSVEYRKAPEHPWPAAPDDAYAGYRWALDHAEELGADPACVAVGGDSAGANLSAVVAQQAVGEGVQAPALQLLIYPAVDMRGGYVSAELFAEGFFLTRSEMDWFADHYVHRDHYEDPRVSPLLGTLEGLPPAYIITAGFDPLRDEGEHYAEALRKAGVRVLTRRFPGMVHGFVNMGTVNRTAADGLVEICGSVRALLHARP
jgi:acetyl esterase